MIDAGQEFPCPFNGLFFKIVTKRPVAQHLKHGMMIGVVPYLFQIVVLARNPQAFLGIGDPPAGGFLVPEKDVFELVHACIGEHQGWIILDHHGCTGNNMMLPGPEKIKKCLSYVGRVHLNIRLTGI